MTTKENILEILREKKFELSKYGIINIGLFGSFIRGEQSKGSDIDLLIDFDPQFENFDNFMATYDIIETLFKGRKVEIITKNGLSPYIGESILKEVQYV